MVDFEVFMRTIMKYGDVWIRLVERNFDQCPEFAGWICLSRYDLLSYV